MRPPLSLLFRIRAYPSASYSIRIYADRIRNCEFGCARLKTVLARTGLSRSTMYRKIAEGTFPSQVKISVHGAGWRESAVNRWIDDPVSYRMRARRCDSAAFGQADLREGQ